MKRLLPLALTGLLFLTGPVYASEPKVALSPEQMAEFQRLLPGVELTPELIRMMTEISLNAEMPVNERMKAIARLSGIDKLPEGQRLKRVICIWDLVGRNGPIFGAAMEARAQALEFGVELEMVPYTNEGVMVEEFKAGRCDAALMSGLRARQFNKYTGTIDAIGAVPRPGDAGVMVNFYVRAIDLDVFDFDSFDRYALATRNWRSVAVDSRSVFLTE